MIVQSHNNNLTLQSCFNNIQESHNDHCPRPPLLFQFLVNFDPFRRSGFRCPQHQPVSNLLASEYLLQGPKSRIGTLYQYIYYYK